MILRSYQAGEEPPVVLLHGLFGMARNLGFVQRALAGRFRVVGLDLRNHGDSPHAPDMRYDVMADDVAETLASLGISGAALKGAANFATGLADSTYKTQFDIDQANKTNSFNKLLALTQVGANAANQTGTFGTQAAQTAGNNITSGANAQAAGTIGATNAITGAANNAANAYQTYTLANKLGMFS